MAKTYDFNKLPLPKGDKRNPWESPGTIIRNALRAAIEHVECSIEDDGYMSNPANADRALLEELRQALEAVKEI